MIRKVYPGLVASDILKVQPMAGPVGTIYSMSYTVTKKPIRFLKMRIAGHWNCRFPPGLSPKTKKEIDEWLSQFPKANYWAEQYNDWGEFNIKIYDEEMLTAFTLRWQDLPQ